MTYGIQCECVQTLLTLLSTPVFSLLQPASQMRIFRAVMGSQSAASLTKALLQNFCEQATAPASYLSEEGGSLVLGIASGVWNILTLGYGSQPPAEENGGGAAEGGGGAESLSVKPLADASALLLLVLTNHCTDCPNPYRDALFNCANVGSSKEPTSPSTTVSMAAPNHSQTDVNTDPAEVAASAASFQIDFGRLFKTLCDTLSADESTLLLYLLLHRNCDFRSHVLASADIERVVLPILRTLYRAPESNNHHIYMSLIVLLILSEDDLFNTSVHDISMKVVKLML